MFKPAPSHLAISLAPSSMPSQLSALSAYQLNVSSMPVQCQTNVNLMSVPIYKMYPKIQIAPPNGILGTGCPFALPVGVATSIEALQ
jgi:hypothetical protein